jgi:hypothetical protein
VVLDERDGIVEIAARLREPAPVRVAIVAGLAVLAWDRSSPVFASGRPAAGVGGTVRSCADALRAVH